MKYTLGTAAKATGKAKSTILRAIKSGVISAQKAHDGSYEIEPSELHRVFDLNGAQTTQSNATQPPEENSAILQLQLNIIEAERQRERQQMQDTIDDLRKRLDNAEGRVTALLADNRTKHSSWWPWKRS